MKFGSRPLALLIIAPLLACSEGPTAPILDEPTPTVSPSPAPTSTPDVPLDLSGPWTGTLTWGANSYGENRCGSEEIRGSLFHHPTRVGGYFDSPCMGRIYLRGDIDAQTPGTIRLTVVLQWNDQNVTGPLYGSASSTRFDVSSRVTLNPTNLHLTR